MTNPIHRSSSATTKNRQERNRRNNEVKELLSTLKSLVSNQTSKLVQEGETMEEDVLENATNCIKNLQKNVEKLKEKKEKLKGIKNCSKEILKPKPSLLNVEARQVDSFMEVLLTTGFDDHFVFPQILKLLHENGAEVIIANKFSLSDRFFHKIIAQVVGEGMAAGGSDFERIRETLKKFVSQYKDGQYNV